jgi:hypothetical protein
MTLVVDNCYIQTVGSVGSGMDETEFLNWVAGAVKLTRLQLCALGWSCLYQIDTNEGKSTPLEDGQRVGSPGRRNRSFPPKRA